jgi:hypothetical protein
VPITRGLASRLKIAAGERSTDAPLLLRADRSAWQSRQRGDHAMLHPQATERAHVTGSMTQLRHSSITCQLLRGVPIRIVATAHDTSIAMIEKTYSAHIADHAAALVRAALLESEPPPADDNIRPLRWR